ncbi:selenide, water dikinase SelD [Sedimentitalea sp. CY04]|uniref:Selenide, water dikinase SelD n=1 Tax=Parasedimentitalea denitrificans TaxID=2211118 RepID=A0ABX0W2T6_9RHOB|nr:selenide, water dikinase SelD [Sedimentitalea sp. CY04]NIZ59951.1 selenide, water dikinase SelD [Sedimentitalea sp. CY04]
MNDPHLPLTRDLVLIGGGHAHALVLRKWGMLPMPGARLTVINPTPTAAYSGMLPGFIAGHYSRDELDIDLVKLARFAGARVILGAATGIDITARQVQVPGRPPVAYDVASIDVGITSEMPNLPGFATHGVPAKPLGTFAAKWDAFRNGQDRAHIAVIGGGVAGVELILAMAHALRQRGRLAQATLIDNAEALKGVSRKARAKLRTALTEQAVTLIENADIANIESDHIRLTDGREVLSDFTTGAASPRPYEWIAQSGLNQADGYIDVTAQLQSSDPVVFAAGDCAHLSHAPRPKAGVFAVRQAPVLFDNLQAAISGGDLRAYKPQKDYLKLISLGEKSALADRFGRAPSGPLMWRWKDHIDQTFMTRFRDLPQMEQPSLPSYHTLGVAEALGDKPMCGGCGAKVGRNALRTALAPMPDGGRDDITPLPGDDAALLTTGGAKQVISTDHLRAFCADPVMMTRIAAVHALGDIWAMAADPQAATANLILPRMSAELQERTLREIIQTAGDVMRDAGAEIIGGHTSLGDELTVGFTVTGLCPRPPVTLAGAKSGDVLILTKPIGSGVIMAAEMSGLADGAWVAAALAQMSRPQARSAKILQEAHAMTDVTGFGLYGHLAGMCEASNVGAEVNFDAVPLMLGAAELAAKGVRSSLFDDNHAIAPWVQTTGAQELLFDPQTAGGLLAAVSADEAEEMVQALHQAGEDAAVIGSVTQGSGIVIA